VPGSHLLGGLFTLACQIDEFMGGIIYQAVLSHFTHSFCDGRHADVFALGDFLDAGDAPGFDQIEDDFKIVFLYLGEILGICRLLNHTP